MSTRTLITLNVLAFVAGLVCLFEPRWSSSDTWKQVIAGTLVLLVPVANAVATVFEGRDSEERELRSAVRKAELRQRLAELSRGQR